MMQFFGVWFLKLKQQDTQVNYNKVQQFKGELRIERNERSLKKVKLTTNWICFSLTEAMEKTAKTGKLCIIIIASFSCKTDLSWKK